MGSNKSKNAKYTNKAYPRKFSTQHHRTDEYPNMNIVPVFDTQETNTRHTTTCDNHSDHHSSGYDSGGGCCDSGGGGGCDS